MTVRVPYRDSKVRLRANFQGRRIWDEIPGMKAASWNREESAFGAVLLVMTMMTTITE